MITRDDVYHIANLAKIELKEEEVEKFRREFEKILEYFSILDEVPEDIEPTFHVHNLSNVFREDEPSESLPRELVLMNAKHVEDGYFKGPKIMEG